MSNKYETVWLDRNSYPTWDQWVNSRPDGTFYHKSFYLETLARLLGLNFSILAVKNKEGAIEGGFAHVHSKKLGRIPYIYAPPVTAYYAPLFAERQSNYASKQESHYQEIAGCITSVLNAHYKLQRMIFQPEVDDIRPFKQAGYRVWPSYTYLADISDRKQLYSNYSSSLKRQIKKGYKRNYRIDREFTDANISTYYALQQKAFARQGIGFAFNKEQFIELVRVMENHDAARIFTIYDADRPVASLILALHQHKAWYLYSGADPQFHNTGLNQVLLHEALITLGDEGIRYFDFVGANTPSISRYKSLYNFKLTHYFVAEKAQGVIPKGYELLKLLR